MALPSGVGDPYDRVELPHFERATSISLAADNLRLCAPAAREGMFPALTTLVLSVSSIDKLSALVPHCPRLRVLKYAVRHGRICIHPHAITVHSESLRELVVESCEHVPRVVIAAPMLEQLAVSYFAGRDLSVAVLAPMAEKVLGQCQYRYPGSSFFTAFGHRDLEMVSLTMAPSTVRVAET